MVDVLKITSMPPLRNKTQGIPGKYPMDAVFDTEKTINVVKDQATRTKDIAGKEGLKSLLRNLNTEIFEPLMRSTSNQAEGLRKLVLMARLFEGDNGLLPEKFLDEIFVRSQDMYNELKARDKAATIFSGDFFDSLRMLAKMEGQPKLREAIVLILRHYEGYINQENSLFAIVKQGKNLAAELNEAESKKLMQQIETLDTMVKLNKITRQSHIEGQKVAGESDTQILINLDKEKQGIIREYLKNEIIPGLGTIARNNQGSNRIYNQIMSIVHNLVRFDKADPTLLEDAIFQFGDEFKRLAELSGDDIKDIKKSIFENALKEQNNTGLKGLDKMEGDQERSEIATLLAKALDKPGPVKVAGVAYQLLMSLVQSENPVTPIIHFMIPFRYRDENIYGEFFVDKECKGRGAKSNNTGNVFFTIQSDKYGKFEVDLLFTDKKIDLDVRCPDALVPYIKEIRGKWAEMVKEQGFKLVNYNVDVYKESMAILQKFPKLASKSEGLNVKV